MNRNRGGFRVAASTPSGPPPSGGDWIPVATDGRWWWDGIRWETTVQSPWPVTAPPPTGRAAAAPRARTAAHAIAAVLTLPIQVAWFVLRPLAGMAIGLVSVVALFVLVAVWLAHSLH